MKPLEPDDIIPPIEGRFRPKNGPRRLTCPHCNNKGRIDVSSFAQLVLIFAAIYLATSGLDGWGWFLFIAVLIN